MTGPILGLDIGGTKLAAGVVDDDGSTLASATTPTRPNDGVDAVLDRLLKLGRSVLDAAGIAIPRAVGIGCGGPLDRVDGVLESPPLLPGWHRVPVVAIVRDSFAAPAYLDNDGAAAAMAEHWYGAGHGSLTMLYLTVSTGIGGGAVLDGRPYRGASDNGCEFGHIGVVRNGRRCLCGRSGCLEAYASGTSIASRAREALRDGAPSSLCQGSGLITAADVVDAARCGDPFATNLWEDTTALLGSALVDLANIFEPERIVLGGGVTKAGRLLFDPCAEIVRQEARSPVLITPSKLGENVGIIGAAVVARQRIE